MRPVAVTQTNQNDSLLSQIFESDIYDVNELDILEEWKLGEMELVAQIVEAEAGNQDLTGKRLVADVVLNRKDHSDFPDTVESVIFDGYQFSPTKDGRFDEAAWEMSNDSFLAVELEWMRESRLDPGILYFSNTTDPVNGRNSFKHMDHWFGY